jgi:hypothetical protein
MDPGEIQVTVETVNGTSDAVTLTVTLPPPLQVASIDPSVGSQLSLSLDISAITGTGFEPGAAVRLEKGEVVIEALDVDVVSDTEITCNVGLFGVEPGQYDVVVINPDGEEARLEEAFTVMGACGQGAGSALLVLGLVMGLLTLAGTRLCGKRRGNISGLMV